MDIHDASIVAAHLLLIEDGQVLLSRRQNTGYEDGNYSVVAGHVDRNETASKAMAREALEEAGLVILSTDLTLAHVMHRNSEDSRVDFFFTTNKWQGEPINREPEKCSELRWYALSDLPTNVIPYVRHAIEQFQQNEYYSEFNW